VKKLIEQKYSEKSQNSSFDAKEKQKKEEEEKVLNIKLKMQ